MPDAAGNLTSAESQKALSWLNSKRPGGIKCTCGQGTMGVNPVLGMASQVKGTLPNLSIDAGTGFVMLPLTCPHCARMELYNVQSMGLLQSAAAA